MHRRRIDQPRAQPCAAFFQRRVQQLRHPRDFVLRRRPRLDAHDRRADRAVPDQHRRIHRRLLRVQQGAIFRHRMPIAGILLLQPVRRHRVARPPRRGARAAVARDFRRHALPDLRRRARLDQQIRIRMRVHVDETRTCQQARRVEFVRRLRPRQIPHRRDAVARESDVGPHACAAEPVHHGPAAQNPIESVRIHLRHATMSAPRRHARAPRTRKNGNSRGLTPGHVERRRIAPESKHLGLISTAYLRNQAEIPRQARDDSSPPSRPHPRKRGNATRNRGKVFISVFRHNLPCMGAACRGGPHQEKS